MIAMRRLPRRSVCAVLGCLAMLLMVVESGSAQDNYPNKPVRLIAPSAGGSGDWSARMLAGALEKEFGQRFLVENRANVVGAELASQAKADGYTLLFYGSGLWMFPLMKPGQASFDPLRDFQPISLLTTLRSIIAVHPSLGVKTVQELIALAKAKPGYLNYSAGQVGSTHHLAAEVFKAMAGVNMVYVSYAGTGQAITSTIAGETQVAFVSMDLAAQHIQAGSLIPLAVLSDKATPLAPGIPTVDQSGLSGFSEPSADQVLWAPAGLPAPILAKLNQATLRFLNSPEVREAYEKRGLEVTGSSPEAVTALVKSELDKWGRLIAERPDLGPK